MTVQELIELLQHVEPAAKIELEAGYNYAAGEWTGQAYLYAALDDGAVVDIMRETI